eukprot:TRINITY_DN16262_c0_g1_i1.p1 TRINITY_DN16262_c0_g1~~TRINITY_DN16262_c0_g1_i1.p1  ORF type:complete len:164 (-),score=43.24 TRINITY_DN16262_c0_g1_i1:670-1161(-)
MEGKVKYETIAQNIMQDNTLLPTKVACIETLTQVLTTIQSNFEETKYRTLLISSAAFKNKIQSVRGGVEFLVAVGFRKKVFEFREHMILDAAEDDEGKEQQKNDLNIAVEVLKETLSKNQEKLDTFKRKQAEQKNEDQIRRDYALARIADNKARAKEKNWVGT